MRADIVNRDDALRQTRRLQAELIAERSKYAKA